MKNFVTSAVLEEAPCMSLEWFTNDKLSTHIHGVLVVKLTTSKGIFIAFYKNSPTSLLRELSRMKVGDKVDIFFRFEHLEGREQVKCFYDVRIHEGDIKRFKQCLWHEEIPVIARIDMFKAKNYLPFETKKMPRFKNWMKPKKTEEAVLADASGIYLIALFLFFCLVGLYFMVWCSCQT